MAGALGTLHPANLLVLADGIRLILLLVPCIYLLVLLGRWSDQIRMAGIAAQMYIMLDCAHATMNICTMTITLCTLWHSILTFVCSAAGLDHAYDVRGLPAHSSCMNVNQPWWQYADDLYHCITHARPNCMLLWMLYAWISHLLHVISFTSLRSTTIQVHTQLLALTDTSDETCSPGRIQTSTFERISLLSMLQLLASPTSFKLAIDRTDNRQQVQDSDSN